MKRSEINNIIDKSIKLMEKYQFLIPSFSYWSPEDWEKNKADCQEMKDNMLGWDITDFGSGDFMSRGLVMLTIRNGNLHMKETYPKAYAEKLLVTEEEQETPCHFHWSKMEDIINRGGGDLIVELWNSTDDNQLDNTLVHYSMDGKRYTTEPGVPILVRPSQSITLETRTYHRFYGKKGTGPVLLGEVSSVNDDTSDNCFLEKHPRFPSIIEDESPKYLLITEY